MTESSQGGQGAGEEPREPFVSQGDRPEVRLNLDTPLSELRLRDLRDILWGGMGGKPHFTDKHSIGETTIVEKIRSAEWHNKIIVDNFKYIQDFKHITKIEFEPPIPGGTGPDPGPLNQVFQAVSGINHQVSQLADQVAELQRRIQG